MAGTLGLPGPIGLHRHASEHIQHGPPPHPGRISSFSYQLELIVKTELAVQNISKAKAGISPNTIHNLDSLHLMLVIDKCDFDIVSAHDSYGSHACNVVEMQKCIREQFKYIIDQDPLQYILNETGNLVPMIKRGNLDSSEILKSEFAFS